MEHLLLSIIGMLVVIIAVLLAKIYFWRKAAREITEGLHTCLTTDTNTLITISSRDTCMCHLTSEINVHLALLRKERLRYQQGDLELKEAVTNISHDLRTPLTAICGYLDLLEREEKSEAVCRYLSRIKNRTEALKHLTEELFRYSIVTSVQELKKERVNVVGILEETLLAFYAAMQEAAIEPEIHLPDEPVWREADEEAVSRIFSNIISNALKYSDGDLIVKMEQDGRIIFSNTASKLDAVMAGRLFERFYTVSSNRNATGLGLSIARILIERMGGSIEAEYQNEILEIKFYLPDVCSGAIL